MSSVVLFGRQNKLRENHYLLSLAAFNKFNGRNTEGAV